LCPVALVDYDGEFPTFPNFDDFNRADEEPLSSPPWSNSTTTLPGQGTRRIKIDSQQAAAGDIGTNHGAQYWDAVIPAGDDGEVFATLAVPGNAGEHLFAAGSGQNSTLSGYANYWRPRSDDRPDQVLYGDSGNAGNIGSRFIIAWADQVADGKWGLQLRQSGAVMQLWLDLGAGWRWVSACRITNLGSLSNGGLFGLNFLNDFVTRIDDFGGGTSSPFLPQIIRRLATSK